ncbi:lycopene cyclase family protein [Streptomyces erythrochromogenes]|uniref:lycopene cyclase family protein n=1 Tax=Streptomyces erythrochromogenes TaxID=285574 RepID=UPI003699D119
MGTFSPGELGPRSSQSPRRRRAWCAARLVGTGPGRRFLRRGSRTVGTYGGRPGLTWDADVTVVGAGAAGLSLAVELSKPLPAGRTALRVAVSEAPPRPLRSPSRTWCHWEPSVRRSASSQLRPAISGPTRARCPVWRGVTVSS